MRYINFVRILCLSFLCAFGACKSTSGNKKIELTPKEEAAASELTMEIEVGRQMAGRLLAGYGVNSDQNLTDYVATVGNYLLSNSEYAGNHYMFAITEGHGVAAYSCPGGYILLSKGSLKSAKNEAEIAGIIAHEISHVGKKHMLTAIKNKKIDEKKKNDASGDAEAMVRERVKANADTRSGAALAKYLSGPNGATISVLMAVSSGISTLLNEGLEPGVEYEADELGLALMMKAGYNGQAFIDYLARLKQAQGSDSMVVVEKTHPSLDTRIEKLQAKLALLKNEYPGIAQGQERFRKAMLAAKIQTQEKNGDKL